MQLIQRSCQVNWPKLIESVHEYLNATDSHPMSLATPLARKGIDHLRDIANSLKRTGSANMKEFDFKFKDIVEFAKDVIIVTKSYPIDEPGPEIVYVNRAFTELTGYSQEEVLGKSPRILQTSETNEEACNLTRQNSC